MKHEGLEKRDTSKKMYKVSHKVEFQWKALKMLKYSAICTNL